MSTRKKIRTRRKVKLVTRIALPVLFAAVISTSVAFGCLYFSENHIKANYFFRKAQKLDEADPYGSREAIKYYNKAIKSYEALGDRGAEVNAYISLGLLHHKIGNIMQVERMVLNAVDIGGDDIPKPMKAKAYMLLASTVEPESAQKYIHEAITIAQELDQKILAVKSYFILAKIYEYKAAFEEAKDTYLKAIQIAEKITPEDGAFDPEPLYANLGELYLGDGSVGNAITYYEKALTAAKSNSEHSISVATYMGILGDLYRERMQLTKACQNWKDSENEYAVLGKQPPMSIMKLSISNNC